MDLDTAPNRQSLIARFPKLSGDINFTINSPINYIYNCIAFAMGVDDRWVDHHIEAPGHWWPEGVPCSDDSISLIKAFEVLGFEKCSDDIPESGFDKVVLYKDDNDKWQHAARVLNTGVYHSKFGQAFDAIHSGGNTLEEGYGHVYCFMRRNKNYKCTVFSDMSDDNRFQKVIIPDVPIVLYIFEGIFYDVKKNRVYLYRSNKGEVIVSYNSLE